MEETNDGEEQSQSKPDEAKEEGSDDEPSSSSLIDDAARAAEELKVQNDRKDKLLDREEKLEALRQLSGKAEAGQPANKKEETPAQYAERKSSGN